MHEFIWANGSRFTKTMDAQAIGEQLDELQREQGGRLTARVVLDAARPETPLHGCFEWDTVRAAELYREDQARYVLRSIRVVQRDDPQGAPSIVHAYVNLVEQVGGDEEHVYVPLARVLSETDLLRQAIARAASELRSFEDRYRAFTDIARAVRQARASIEAAVPA